MLFLIYNLIFSSIYIDIITDLHAYPYKIPHELKIIKKNVDKSDFIVFNGDILNNVHCPKHKSCDIYNLTYDIVSIINKPYLFTLGNHDGEGKIRSKLIDVLYYHPNHIGICNNKKKACRHPNLNIFTLDSNTYHCDNEQYSYGCPYREDVKWIDKNVDIYNHTFMILFTHIPPPFVLGLNGYGICDERPGCWNSKSMSLLPKKAPIYHIFGHDHDNLYKIISDENITYINALKTGDKRSYGPSFGSSGITRIGIDNYVPFINVSKSLDGNNVYEYDKKIKINYSFCSGKEALYKRNKILMISTIVILIFIVLSLVIYKKYKKYNKYKNYNSINSIQ